jgi:hypothetical protein
VPHRRIRGLHAPRGASARPIEPGETVTIEISRRDGHLSYYVDGVRIGVSKGDPGPLKGFWFAASAGSDESWDVHIDELTVE